MNPATFNDGAGTEKARHPEPLQRRRLAKAKCGAKVLSWLELSSSTRRNIEGFDRPRGNAGYAYFGELRSRPRGSSSQLACFFLLDHFESPWIRTIQAGFDSVRNDLQEKGKMPPFLARFPVTALVWQD